MLLGLAFGVGLGPCSFALLAPVLALALCPGTAEAAGGGALLSGFALGHCGVIVAAGAAAGWVGRYLARTAASSWSLRLRQACGAALILAGLALLERS